MRKSILILCVSLLLDGSIFTGLTASLPQGSVALEWANGNPLRVDEVEGSTIGRVEFAGNEITRDIVVRRALGMREGRMFKRKHLRHGLRRLNQLGLFEKVGDGDVVFRADRERGQVDLLLVVKERHRR